MKNDKLLHFLVGGSIGLLTLPVAFYSGFWWACIITLVFGSIIFVGKEMYDERKKYPTGFDKVDLAADYLGWCGGSIVSLFAWGIVQIIQL